MYTAEEVAAAIFQDSGSEFGGDASDSDFEVSHADNSSSSDNNSDFQVSLPSDHDSADSEPEPEHAAAPIPVRHLLCFQMRNATTTHKMAELKLY